MIKDIVRYMTFPLMAFFWGLYPSVGAAQIPFDQTIGDWETSPLSFDHRPEVICFAKRKLDTKKSILVTMYDRFDVEIGISDRSQNFSDIGGNIPLSATLNGIDVANQGQIRGPALFVIELKPKYQKVIYAALQYTPLLETKTNATSYQFQFNDEGLIAALTDCVAEYVPRPPSGTKEVSFTGSSPKEELSNLLRHVMKSALIQDYEFVSPTDSGLPDDGQTIYWLRGNAFGAITIVDSPGDINDAGASQVVAYEKQCGQNQGQFDYDVIASPQAMAGNYRRLWLYCSAIGNGNKVQVALLKRATGGFYSFHLSGITPDGSPDEASAQKGWLSGFSLVSPFVAIARLGL